MKRSLTVTDYFLLPESSPSTLLSSGICFLSCIKLALSVHMYLYVGISCGQPDSPSNGQVNTSAGTSSGDVARYSCNTGYTLNGTAERTCQANREWSGSVPTCESEILG